MLFCLVPSYQGNAINDATLVLKIGGKQVTEHLMNLLMNGKYSFPDDNFLLWRKKKKTKFTVSSRKEIIRELKVITILFWSWKLFLTSKSSILHTFKSYLVKLKPLTELNLLQEQYCNVSPNYTLSYEDASFPETSIRLPDGNMIVMGRETFMAPEIMFQVKIKMRLI